MVVLLAGTISSAFVDMVDFLGRSAGHDRTIEG
jgi:hypothetical protein